MSSSSSILPKHTPIAVLDKERWYRNSISSRSETNVSNVQDYSRKLTPMDRKIRHARQRIDQSPRGRVYYGSRSSMPRIHAKNWTITQTTSAALRTSKWNGHVSHNPKSYAMFYILSYNLPVDAMMMEDVRVLNALNVNGLNAAYSVKSSVAVWINGTWTTPNAVNHRISPNQLLDIPSVGLKTLWLFSLMTLLQSASFSLYSTRCLHESSMTVSKPTPTEPTK